MVPTSVKTGRKHSQADSFLETLEKPTLQPSKTLSEKTFLREVDFVFSSLSQTSSI